MSVEVVVPQLGESITEGVLARWLKKPGERVERDEPIAELETDKVAVEVPAPEAGVLEETLVEEGETVKVGAVIARIGEGGGAKTASAKASAERREKDRKKADAGAEDGTAEKKRELVDIVVPQAGESVTEGTLASWLKKQGEEVEEGETVAELETDKAALELPAPVAGVLAEVLVEEGATVHPGDVIGRIAKGEKAAARAAAPAGRAEFGKAESGEAEAGAMEAPAGEGRPLSPAVRRIIEQYHLDPDSIPATGKDGRLTKEDVLRAIDSGIARIKPDWVPRRPAAAAAEPAGEAAPREERVPMSRLRKRIAERLKQAQSTAAMLTTFNDVDMSAVIAERQKYRDLFEKKHGIRLGFMSFFVKAAVMALKEVPAVNARIDGDDIVYQNFYDIGVAVAAPQGLVVPVVRDADRLSFADTEKTIAELAKKARDGKLTLEDLQGGTFTITNGGIFGSLFSTPILNPPQSAILGMHRIEERPVVKNGEIVIRPMMYLALTYDHRLIDGREAVTFLKRIKEAIEDPSRLLLDL
ncbi:MAG: dihydrolipoyllysine-residue succinyltransferase component of 2-oxoglutarate dehydrogenase complex [Rhodothalassiaceae bacterium]|nr:MAG: dihydrolipoyllysine-residue succinyltransferase component of 2-oxoglutarate dehydrogenase complex [Rhodothalassiaceae bacterium]